MEQVAQKVEELLRRFSEDYEVIAAKAKAEPGEWQQAWTACRERLPLTFAVKILRDIAAARPKALGIQITLADVYARLGAIDQVDTIVEPLIAEGETNMRMLRLHGQVATRLRRPDLAAERYRALLQHHPNDAPSVRNLANAYRDMEDYQAAIATVEGLLRLEELAGPADHLALAQIRAASEGQRFLLEETQALVERFPDDVSIIEYHVACLHFHRKFDAAEAFAAARGRSGKGQEVPEPEGASADEADQEQAILQQLDAFAESPFPTRAITRFPYPMGQAGLQRAAMRLLNGLAAGDEWDVITRARSEVHLFNARMVPALRQLQRSVELWPSLPNHEELAHLLIDCGRLRAAGRQIERIRQDFGALPNGRDALAQLNEDLAAAQARQDKDPGPELPPAGERYIFDIGAHMGEDSDFYLRKGFKVVAVEAFPDHVTRLRTRFRSFVDDGFYMVEPVAIGARDEMGSFFVHHEKTDWHRAEPDPDEGRGAFREIAVRFSSVETLLDSYPTPYYVKIDIEGNDHFVIEAMTASRKPTYLSYELGPGCEDWLNHLIAIGYRYGQIVDQSKYASLRCPYPPREGNYAWTRFNGHMSGLFGRDLPDKWIDINEIHAQIDALTFDKGEWHDVHVC